MVTLSANTPTARVVARLQADGWVECLNLDFPALQPPYLSDLNKFVLTQLHTTDGWMWEHDLKLKALVFSIPSHQFELHPHLPKTLNQLTLEKVIEIKQGVIRSDQKRNADIALVLSRANVA